MKGVPAKMIFSRQIAALPGWSVLTVLYDDAGLPIDAEQSEIVAWAFIDGDELSVPYPVTMSGVQTNDPPIRKPSGGVDALDCDAPTVAAWIEHLQAQLRHEAVKS